jgi:glycosyltransferase involved in cell wall biosynthesis
MVERGPVKLALPDFWENKGERRSISLRLAFVQDALPFFGGAERVLAQALRVFPGTPVYTLVYDPHRFSGTPLEHQQVHTTFIDHLPGAHWNHRWFLPLYPAAIEALDLSAYDMVVSFSYAVAHGVITRPDQRHIALIHTPLRQAYHPAPPLGGWRGLAAWPVERLLDRLRAWNVRASARPDHMLAISHWVGQQVWNAFNRKAPVLYPPVEVERFTSAPQRDRFYMALARLEGHKRLDLAIRAFNQLGLPLVIVGEGRQRRRLEQLAHPNIRFLGHLSDAEVASLLGRACALIHPAEEDFGIAIVEAQAAGCPVIAYAGGGAAETVIAGRTGILFPSQEVGSLVEAVLAFEKDLQQFSPLEMRQSAERFSAPRFRHQFASIVYAAWHGELSWWGDDESYKQSFPIMAHSLD